MASARYSISQVARCFGLRVSALRYYDELGLLPPAERRGTVRYYGPDQLRRLALIQRLHHRGLVSLTDTGALLTEQPPASQPTSRELLTRSVAAINSRIAELTSAVHLLEHLLSCPRADPVRECGFLRAELDQCVADALAPLTPDQGSPETP